MAPGRGRQSQDLVFYAIYRAHLKFEPPQLHQIFTRGYGAGRNPAFVSGCAGVAPRFVEPVYGCLVCPRNQVPIDVHGHLDRMVAHLVFHVDDRLSVLEQARSEGMPEIVESNAPETCLSESLMNRAKVRRPARVAARYSTTDAVSEGPASG